MFEVGKDIFKYGFSGVRGEATGRKRLRVMYTVIYRANITVGYSGNRPCTLGGGGW